MPEHRSQPSASHVSPGAIPESIPVSTTFDFPDWKVGRYVGATFGLIVRSMVRSRDRRGIQERRRQMTSGK
jgi:hypothetical protein